MAHIESRLPRDRDILVHCKTGTTLTLPRYVTHTCYLHSLAFRMHFNSTDTIACSLAGIRSAAACASLSALGFDRLYNLDGGVIAWAREIDPKLPTY